MTGSFAIRQSKTISGRRDDGKRFVVRADEMLTAFLGLEIGDSPRCLLSCSG
jgi:hypothetical protein